MKRVLQLNVILIISYLVAFFFQSKSSFSFFIALIGTALFFLPGLNLALAWEQATAGLGRIKIIIWSFILSSILVPLFVFYIPLSTVRTGQEKEALLSLFLAILLSLTVFLTCHLFFKKPVTVFYRPSFSKHAPFWIALSIFMIILVSHFAIYPLLPEADSYNYIEVIEKTVQTGHFYSLGNRVLFYALVWTFHHLTQIPIYWIFKAAFPLFGFFFILLGYQLSSRLDLPKKFVILGSFSFLFFPAIFQESLIVRPQLFFLFFLPLMMFLLLEGLRQKDWQAAALIFFLAVLATRMHQVFIFLLPPSFLIIMYLVLKKYHVKGMIVFGLSFFIMFLLGEKKLLELWSYVMSISQYHPTIHFRLWFLNDYTNSYGEKMSWPGLSFLYYYGYTLGLVFPALLALCIWKKMRFPLLWRHNWPLAVTLGSFLFFAEFLPRFGIAYEPKRFMFFSALMLAFFIPLLLVRLYKKMSPDLLFWLLVFLSFATFSSSLFLTYSKQGIVTQAEYQAGEFIQKNTPPDAVFITQGGNGILFSFFYHRHALTNAPSFFLKHDAEKEAFFLAHLEELLAYQRLLKKQNPKTSDDAVFSAFYGHPDFSFPSGLTASPPRPLYIFFSTSKFEGFRGKREWWRKLNYAETDLEKFEDEKMYQKVYDEDGVMIWKYIGQY